MLYRYFQYIKREENDLKTLIQTARMPKSPHLRLIMTGVF